MNSAPLSISGGSCGRLRRFVPLLVYCALVLLIASVFGSATWFGFLPWDDTNLVVSNPGLNPPTWHHLWEFWRYPYQELYTPLAYTFWTALTAATGYAPQATTFHLANLLLHAATVGCVFLLLRQLLPGKLFPAATGAAIFAIHPLQVEPVVWVSGMNNLLAACLSIASLWMLARSLSVEKLSAGRWWYAAATALFALALLAKPTAIVVPLVAMVMGVWLMHRRFKMIFRLLAPWLLLALVTSVVAKQVQPAPSVEPAAIWFRPFVAMDALSFYAAKLIAPLGLTVDYGRTPEWLLESRQFTRAWIVPVALAAIAWSTRQRFPAFGAGIAISTAAVLPVLGLVPFDFQEWSTVSDRYNYLAMLGPAVFVACAARAWRWAGVVTIVIVAVLSVVSARQVAYWRDPVALFQHNLEINPNSLAAPTVLGFVAKHAGRFDEAEQRYLTALRVRPADGPVHFNLGNLYLAENRPRKAAREFAGCVAIDPSNARFRNSLGAALGFAGDHAAAIVAFRDAIRLDSHYVDPHLNLAKLFAIDGDETAARAEYEAARQIDPSVPRF